ncbi:MAG: TonB-dependent receptor [Chitinophagaceae bacterium]|nr:TonB-dependent receptor [Chitinophagaceae bacterium]
MNLTTVFLFVLSVSVSAKVSSQTVSLSETNVPLEKVFKEINRQTGYTFVYTRSLLKKSRNISINVQDIPVERSLDICFKDQPLTYTILNMMVVIKERERAYTAYNTEEAAQPVTAVNITGKVTDEKGLPLEGASILVKGTSNGVKSDAGGVFSIEADPNSILVISYIGFEPTEVRVNNRTVLSVQLKPSFATGEEVVIGYSVQKKVNLTGAVSSINFESKETESRPLVNVSSALQGLAAGALVVQSTGNPQNNNADITIRGVGTLNSGSEPLVIIDGQPGDMNTINPIDVASVSILKDAASSAIYGSRAANGVILITTKSGSNSNGKITFNYNGYAGTTTPTKVFDIISYTPDYMELVNRIQRNSGVAEAFTPERIAEWAQKSKTDPILYPNTDWYSVIMKPNLLTSHTISARGGNEKLNIYSAVGYQDNNGVVLKTGVKRFNFRNNLSYRINNWLKLGNIITGNFQQNPPDITNSLFIVYPNPSITPIYNGIYGTAMSGGLDTQAGNLLEEIDSQKGETKRQNYTGKIYAILTPVTGLNITGSYFLDKSVSDGWGSAVSLPRKNFQTDVFLSTGSAYGSAIYRNFGRTDRKVVDIYADYQRSLGSHAVKLLAGFNQEQWDNTYFSASKLGLISNDLNTLDAAAFQPQTSGSGQSYRTRSYFGRLNYSFNDRYLFEANIRTDGSSRFSPENRWGTFPSFSAGWIASKEEFWDALGKTVDFFKIRASWGRLGNNGIGNYAWQDVYGPSNYSFNGAQVQGLAPGYLVNSDITWETTDVTNIGVDIDLLNKFSVTVDYYDKFTHGILADMPIPGVNGPLDPPLVNAAEVRNKGIEVDAKFHERIGKLSIAAGILAAYNNNKIVKYKGPDVIENQGSGASAWAEGKPIGIFWVREVDHIVQDQKEIDQLVNAGYTWEGPVPGPGDFLYKDANNDKIFQTDETDMVLKGNPIPVYNYAVNLNLAYGGFDFYVMAYGVAKWTKQLGGYSEGLNAMVGGYGYAKRWLNSWTPENKSTTIPKIYLNDGRNSGDNDYFLSPGDYFRIKSIQLGYTLPQHLVRRAKVDRVRFFVNFESYFQWTRYRGMDPETNNLAAANSADGGGASSSPNYTNTYPLFKTASFGVNVSF